MPGTACSALATAAARRGPRYGARTAEGCHGWVGSSTAASATARRRATGWPGSRSSGGCSWRSPRRPPSIELWPIVERDLDRRHHVASRRPATAADGRPCGGRRHAPGGRRVGQPDPVPGERLALERGPAGLGDPAARATRWTSPATRRSTRLLEGGREPRRPGAAGPEPGRGALPRRPGDRSASGRSARASRTRAVDPGWRSRRLGRGRGARAAPARPRVHGRRDPGAGPAPRPALGRASTCCSCSRTRSWPGGRIAGALRGVRPAAAWRAGAVGGSVVFLVPVLSLASLLANTYLLAPDSGFSVPFLGLATYFGWPLVAIALARAWAASSARRRAPWGPASSCAGGRVTCGPRPPDQLQRARTPRTPGGGGSRGS